MTNLHFILNNKDHSPRQKAAIVLGLLLENPGIVDTLVEHAQPADNAIKMICLEALHLATKTKPAIATEACFKFITCTLAEKSPPLKWKSAKVVANTAHLHADILDETIKNLVSNSTSSGIMVRWCAAYALVEIAKLNSVHNENLIPEIKAINHREKNSNVKRIYDRALQQLHWGCGC